MNEEVKETALKLSDYAEAVNQKIKRRLFWLTIAALLGMIVFVIIEALGLDTPGSIFERIASAGLGFVFGMLIVIALYLSGILGKIKAGRMISEIIEECLESRAAAALFCSWLGQLLQLCYILVRSRVLNYFMEKWV